MMILITTNVTSANYEFVICSNIPGKRYGVEVGAQRAQPPGYIFNKFEDFSPIVILKQCNFFSLLINFLLWQKL